MNSGLYDCVCCELKYEELYVLKHQKKLLNTNAPKSDLVDINTKSSPIITTSPTKSQAIFLVSIFNFTSVLTRSQPKLTLLFKEQDLMKFDPSEGQIILECSLDLENFSNSDSQRVFTCLGQISSYRILNLFL